MPSLESDAALRVLVSDADEVSVVMNCLELLQSHGDTPLLLPKTRHLATAQYPTAHGYGSREDRNFLASARFRRRKMRRWYRLHSNGREVHTCSERPEMREGTRAKIAATGAAATFAGDGATVSLFATDLARPAASVERATADLEEHLVLFYAAPDDLSGSHVCAFGVEGLCRRRLERIIHLVTMGRPCFAPDKYFTLPMYIAFALRDALRAGAGTKPPPERNAARLLKKHLSSTADLIDKLSKSSACWSVLTHASIQATRRSMQDDMEKL